MLNLDFSFVSWAVVQQFLLKGLYFTLVLTIVSTIGGIVLGTVLALMRLSGNRILEVIASTYINGMRSIPLVMVILWFYLLLPASFYDALNVPTGLRKEFSASATFIAFQAAYFAEIVRAGIQSIPIGQVYAGRALGMTYAQNMRLVILPQAFRNMLPVFLTQVIVLLQDTSLVYAIGAYDLFKGFVSASREYGRPIEAYLLAAVVYFIICYGLSQIVKHINKKIAIIR